MNNKIVVGLLVLLVGVGAGWYFLQGSKQAPGTMKKESGVMETTTPAVEPTLGSESPATGSSGSAGVPATAGGNGTMVFETSTVTYTDSGFSPKTITVKKGTTVKFINQGTGTMWVASAVHPTHQLLPGFDQLKSVGKGGMYEYTFAKVGTWKYHNHVAASDTGTVVVTE